MTVDEAIKLFEKSIKFAEREETAKALKAILSILQQQQQQIEQLKCCGNCEHYQPEFEGCGKQQVIVCRNETCDAWEETK